jgi:choline transport protein
VNFNWACVLFVGLMGFASLMYIFHARNTYEGPVLKVMTKDSE